jgi:hypothetical protein
VTVCSSSGAFTRIVSRVVGARGHFSENAFFERRHRFHCGLEQALGRNAHGVLDPFGVGEGDEARADGHDFSIGEKKTNTTKVRRVINKPTATARDARRLGTHVHYFPRVPMEERD